MFETFNKLPDLFQGIIFTFAGSVLLLYALGFIQKGVTILVIVLALCLILIGLIKLGLMKKIMKLQHNIERDYHRK